MMSVLAMIALCQVTSALASTASIDQALEKYNQTYGQAQTAEERAQAMNQIPQKEVVQGGIPTLPFVNPNQSAQEQQAFVQGRSWVDQKDKGLNGKGGRAQVCEEIVDQVSESEILTRTLCLAEQGFAPAEPHDQVSDLVTGVDLVTTLEEMENRGWKQGQLDETPWSDTYWPIYQGILGARYADSSFAGSSDFLLNLKSAMEIDSRRRGDKTTITSVNKPTKNYSSVDTLSPAEKYDLLVGDENWTLTKWSWSEGTNYYNSNGSVETWMGVCHGWAPAAYKLPRAKNTITLVAADGRTKIKFYPSDIKGLGTVLWANANTPSRFIGGRCNTKDPATDSSGRVTDSECFDNNPGTWHQVVVNQISNAKESFVIDATFDYEVWNQPVYSYDYEYFVPTTRERVSSLDAAKVSMREFESKDPYNNARKNAYRRSQSGYRYNDVVSVVGVAMTVTYVVENQPSHNETDSADKDYTNSATYLYDLELDAKGNIIGGEWYQNTHPDFLWTPAYDRAQSQPEARGMVVGRWDVNKPVPQTWQRAAKSASAQGTPLASIVESMIAYTQVQGRHSAE